MKTVNPDIISELTFKTSRASGKGGQHVNKTESRVSLFFNVRNSLYLSSEQKKLLSKSPKIKVNSKGEIQIDVEESRSQKKNKAIAIERFLSMLKIALKKKKPRKATKPTKAAIRKRLRDKKAQSNKKQLRKKEF